MSHSLIDEDMQQRPCLCFSHSLKTTIGQCQNHGHPPDLQEDYMWHQYILKEGWLACFSLLLRCNCYIALHNYVGLTFANPSRITKPRFPRHFLVFSLRV